MIGGDPKRKWGSLPLSGSKGQKSQFLSKARGRRTIAILLRAEDKKISWDTKDSKSFKPVLKTVQSLVARERRKFSSGTPSKIR